MAQCFYEFRDSTYDHENFPHGNLVLRWAWLYAVHIAACALAASEHMHVRAYVYVSPVRVSNTVQ